MKTKAQYELGNIMIYLILIILAALIISAVGYNLFQKAQKPATETPTILPLIIPPIRLKGKKGAVDPLVYLIIAIVLTVIFTITAIVALKFMGLV
jgi:hypothetical protein